MKKLFLMIAVLCFAGCSVSDTDDSDIAIVFTSPTSKESFAVNDTMTVTIKTPDDTSITINLWIEDSDNESAPLTETLTSANGYSTTVDLAYPAGDYTLIGTYDSGLPNYYGYVEFTLTSATSTD